MAEENTDGTDTDTDAAATADTLQSDSGQDSGNAAAEDVATETAGDTPSPASGAGAGGGGGAGAAVSGSPIDIDAELTAKDALIEKYEAGDITHEDYVKGTAKHDRAIVKAQRELAKPAQAVQATYEQQAKAHQYWQQWGKGDDLGQKLYGKTVKADRAAALFREAMDEVSANPRYQGRREMDASSIAYDKWIDKLDAESKRKPGTAPRQASAPQTRVSGDTPVSQSGGHTPRMTAREKLDAGHYNIE